MSKCIQTDPLLLRPLTAADADNVVSGLNDLAVSQWLAKVPYPFSRADLRPVTDTGKTRRPQRMAITVAGRAIGSLCVGAHFGFWLRRDVLGQRCATKVTAAALPLARQMPQTCESGCFIGKTTSARILHRLGFRVTARPRSFCRALGQERPSVTLGLQGGLP